MKVNTKVNKTTRRAGDGRSIKYHVIAQDNRQIIPPSATMAGLEVSTIQTLG